MGTFSKLQKYMGSRKFFFPLAIILSGVSALMSIAPFVLIWLIVKEMLIVGINESTNVINVYAWWAVITAVGSVVLYFLALMFSHLAAFRVEVNIRRNTMKKIIGLPLGFFENNTSGKIRKIIDDNAGITHSFLAHQLPDLAGTILIPIVTLVLLFVFDWRLGLACLVPLAFAIFIMSFMAGKKGRYFMRRYMDSLEDMNTEAVEYVRGIPVVKVFQQTIYSFKNFYKSIMNYKDMVFKYTMIWEKPMSLYIVLINGVVYFLVPVAILLIGNSTSYLNVLIDLIFYILVTPVFAQSVMRSMHLSQAIGQATEAVNRIESLTNVKPLKIARNPKLISSYDVSFEDVSFTYPGGENKAIDKINFGISKGQTVALVGSSGSGKTTIARMIPRFWDVDEGEVKIGGVNVKDVSLKNLMKNISFVFQNTKLFKTTLLENIIYGNPDASFDEINEAIDLAQCRDVIEKMPKGLDTKIGTKGTYLSGGERQRIALARAILKNSPIVVLDEATAFTDPENEYLIQRAFETLTKGKTVLIIAHRLTSVVDADKILVVDKGKIIEKGTHKELLDMKGVYFNMWQEYKKSAKWTISKKNKGGNN